MNVVAADIYAAIAGHLIEYPVVLLRLSLVDRAANMTIAKLLVERAIVEFRKKGGARWYQRLVPYRSTCGGYANVAYKLKWGCLYVTIRGYGPSVSIRVYHNHGMSVAGHVNCSTGEQYHIYPMFDRDRFKSAVRFIVRLFPGLCPAID